MARAIWKASIAFGLVNVPVQLFPATKDRGVHFHILDKDGTCRLRNKLYCPKTGKEYARNETARGFEIGPDKYVIVSDEDMDSIRPEKGSTIEIKEFIELGSVDPIYFERPYYLVAEERTVKAYRLLHKAMLEMEKVAIVKFVMRRKEYLGVVRPLESVLCLETMHFADEIVGIEELPQFPEKAAVGEKELQMASELLTSMTEDFDLGIFEDEYRKRLLEMIHTKARGKKIAFPTEIEAPPAKVIDIMDALQKSLQQKKKLARAAKSERRRKTA